MAKYKNLKQGDHLYFGDHLYYSQFSKNPEQIRALVNTTKEALTAYDKFLNEAIKAEKEKGSYEIQWKKIESNFTLSIVPIYSKFKIEKPKTILKIFIDNDIEIKENRNKLFFDTKDEIKRFDKNDVIIKDNCIYLEKIDILPEKNEILELNNIEVAYELENISLNKNDILEYKNERFKIEDIEKVENGWNVTIKTDKNIKEFKFNDKILKATKYQSNFNQLFDGNNEFIFEKIGNEYQCETKPISKILKDENGNEYQWEEKKNNRGDIVIQLIDDEKDDNEKPISEHFFEDNVNEVYQDINKNITFKIKSKKVDDKILILRQDWKNPKYLKENEPIKIKVNTGNLKRQRESVKILNDSPLKEQQNLIKLFETKRKGLWKNSEKIEIQDNEWYLLKDEKFDGTLEQREFVKKAIVTNDYAILEGPPGSGKTTTILELILQLLKRDKKILLSASTHVAIDNVLERIEKYDVDKNAEILRIGKSENVGEAVQHFQIDEKIKQYTENGFDKEMAKKIVLDSANLVCGTTMGINQFPLIKNRKDKLPIDVIFDYLIIDESSKTTFQEFLVPAMLAKKKILVGDIKQLSPFIEQSHIIHNLNVSITKERQKAIRIVFETLYNNQNPYIVEVSENEEKEIKKYLDSWAKKEDNPYKDKIISYSDERDLFKLLGSDLILIEEGSFEERKKELPKTHLLILKRDIENSDFYFKQNYLNKKRKLPKYKTINKNNSKTNSPIEYKNFFKEMLRKKNWAEEISWRMIRVYERRMLKNPNSYYEKTFELLKPIDENNSVDRIYNMTLPSILESIQVGNGEKHRNKTTITDGFDERDLKQRHEILKTQHRMHPDISKFSREQFYQEENALQDAKTINREWNYDRYKSRAVWIDVKKYDKDKNDRRNLKEAKIIIEEIKEFLEFAKQNPYNQDNQKWSIAVLTFYRPQESILREELRKLCHQPNKMSRFHKENVDILLYTVDKFQGMEADIVFLSMVRNKSIGFMDNINRLNVALTRAKYQRVIVGNKKFFENQDKSEELKKLASEG